MSDNNLRKSPAAFLARLSGRFSGGTSVDNHPQPQQERSVSTINTEAVRLETSSNNAKPKRDIKELYDFIDNWCKLAE